VTGTDRSSGFALALAVTLALCLATAGPAFGAFGFLSKWGSEGTGNGQFTTPQDLTVAPNGDVYVVDSSANRVQRFSPSGTFISAFGSTGSGPGQFDFPTAIDADSSGNLYVVDGMNARVQKFAPNGTFIDEWDALGTGDGEFDGGPSGVAIDSGDRVFVSEFGPSRRIQRFDQTGAFQGKFSMDGAPVGTFGQSKSLAVAPSGAAYVYDIAHFVVQRFDASGTFQGSWNPAPSVSIAGGITVEPSGDVLVSWEEGVLRFSSTGTPKGSFGAPGSGNGEFDGGAGLDTDASGNVYVVDRANHRVQKWGEGGVPPGGGDPGGGGPGGGDPGGGSPGGSQATGAALHCNRGPDPSDPWTCTATVADSGQNATAPGGVVRFSADRGGTLPSGETCALVPSQTLPTRASCQATFVPPAGNGTVLTATYEGDGVHRTASATFRFYSQGDVLVCGAAPLPACPPGEPPPQVCVSIWTLDCEGRFPKPDPVDACVSAWQRCDGFGGSGPARPGTIDLSGLPTGITTRGGCRDERGSSPRQSPRQTLGSGFFFQGCSAFLHVGRPSRIRDRAEYDANARRFAQTVREARNGPFSTSINSLLRIAQLAEPELEASLRSAMNTGATRAFNCIAEVGRPASYCDFDLEFAFLIARAPCDEYALVSGGRGSEFADARVKACNDAYDVFAAGLTSYISRLGVEKDEVWGVAGPFAENQRAKGITTITPLLAGSFTAELGASDKFRLRVTKHGRRRLEKLSSRGVRRLGTVAVSNVTPMPGLNADIDKEKVTLTISGN
jgi:hypothetical protein